MNYTLFISDLHLEPSRPDIADCFVNLLKNQARQADALYILGDLFEAWIGDDNLTTFNRSILGAIRSLADNDTPIYVMRGNRDFLFGEAFTNLTGAQLLTDPTTIRLYGHRITLTHGDILCTQDRTHQRFRNLVHNPCYNRYFLCLPLWLRRTIARVLRNLSRRHTKRLDYVAMDVAPEAVAALLHQQQTMQLIHGHTHRPAIHTFILDGHPAQRIVLGDWHKNGSMLIYYANGDYQLQTLAL